MVCALRRAAWPGRARPNHLGQNGQANMWHSSYPHKPERCNQKATTMHIPDLYFDKAGQPIDTDTYLKLHMDPDYKRVARTTVASAADPAKAFDVSTVWLGMNHGLGSPPIIFETMVFGNSEDLTCHRYSTEAAATAGHAEMVTVVAATLEDPLIVDAVATEFTENDLPR